jgi:hypothetical protein
MSRFQNENHNHSCAFLLGKNRARKSHGEAVCLPNEANGPAYTKAPAVKIAKRFFVFVKLSGRSIPLRPTGFKKWFHFGTGSHKKRILTAKSKKSKTGWPQFPPRLAAGTLSRKYADGT